MPYRSRNRTFYIFVVVIFRSRKYPNTNIAGIRHSKKYKNHPNKTWTTRIRTHNQIDNIHWNIELFFFSSLGLCCVKDWQNTEQKKKNVQNQCKFAFMAFWNLNEIYTFFVVDENRDKVIDWLGCEWTCSIMEMVWTESFRASLGHRWVWADHQN